MPKPISVMIEIEEIAFGKVWRTLDAMTGVVNIDIKGNGPKPKSVKPNGKTNGGSPKKGAMTVPQIVLTSLVGGVMSKEQLGEALVANGKAKTSLPDAMTKLKNAKQIKIIGKGTYKITASGRKVITE